MTTETTATPAADMLIRPRMTPDPSPLRISTFAQPEYAKLTFLYGKGEGVSPTTPVHAREFTVKIPTGSQAGALTAEPDLIRYELTVTGDRRDWRIDKDSRDPNQVIFTCLPPYQETAVFDGTWQIKLELWGIEVNTGIGPVEVAFQEETSRTGNDNDWAVRTGRGEVSKRDDSFVFHSLRAATTVINRDTTAKLDWEGTANAIYTMYYRNAAGVNTPVTVSGGTWTTPADAPLKQHTDFILKASFGGQDYYLTTSVEVKDPDVTVNNLTTNGPVTANDSITLAAKKTIKTDYINARVPVDGILVGNHMKMWPGMTFTANDLTANGDVTIDAERTLRVQRIARTSNAGHIGFANSLEGLDSDGKPTALSIKSDVIIESSKTLKAAILEHPTAVGSDIDVNSTLAFKDQAGISLPRGGGQITVYGALTAKAGPDVGKGDLIANGPLTVNRGAAFAGSLDGIISTPIGKGTWTAPYVTYPVPADGVFMGKNDSGKRCSFGVKSGSTELYKFNVEAWHGVTIPVKKGWVVFRNVDDGSSANFIVALFPFGSS